MYCVCSSFFCQTTRGEYLVFRVQEHSDENDIVPGGQVCQQCAICLLGHLCIDTGKYSGAVGVSSDLTCSDCVAGKCSTSSHFTMYKMGYLH